MQRHCEYRVGNGAVAKVQVADPVETVRSRQRHLDLGPGARIAVLHRENGGEKLDRPARGKGQDYSGRRVSQPQHKSHGTEQVFSHSPCFQCDQGEHLAVAEHLDTPGSGTSSNCDQEGRVAAIAERHITCPECRSGNGRLHFDPRAQPLGLSDRGRKHKQQQRSSTRR